MSSGLGTVPDCWHCPHEVHVFGCDFCDCPTSTVGSSYDHAFDVTNE